MRHASQNSIYRKHAAHCTTSLMLLFSPHIQRWISIVRVRGKIVLVQPINEITTTITIHTGSALLTRTDFLKDIEQFMPFIWSGETIATTLELIALPPPCGVSANRWLEATSASKWRLPRQNNWYDLSGTGNLMLCRKTPVFASRNLLSIRGRYSSRIQAAIDKRHKQSERLDKWLKRRVQRTPMRRNQMFSRRRKWRHSNTWW